MIDYRQDMPTEQRLMLSRAMFHIGRMSETKPAYDFFLAELVRLDKLNRKEPDETQFRIRQGACQVLEDLAALIEKARDRMGEFENMNKPQTFNIRPYS